MLGKKSTSGIELSAPLLFNLAHHLNVSPIESERWTIFSQVIFYMKNFNGPQWRDDTKNGMWKVKQIAEWVNYF